MALTNPRIIVVDENQGITNIVRASLELLSRKPRLIETHTGEDALDELRLRTPDLLITAHQLGSDMSGVVLALQAKREVAALPVIVIANEDDHEMDEETLSESPFQYLRRPLMPEVFIRALRIALDGPEAAPKEEAPVDIMGPVPQIDTNKLRPIASKLMRDVNAMSFVLADRNGKVVTYDGAAGYIDREVLSAGLGPTFAGTSKILSIVGDQPRVLKYYDGDKFDIFSLGVGLHYFVSLIFDGASGDRALGNVKRFGGIAVNEMLAIIGESAYKQNKAGLPETESDSKARTRRRATQEMAAVNKVASAPARKDSAPPPVKEAPMFEPITNFDPSIFDALDSMDLSQADALFDPDRLALSLNGLGNGNKISLNDAQAQGILGSVDD